MIVSFFDSAGRVRFVMPFGDETLPPDFTPYLQIGGGYAEERSDPRSEYFLGGEKTERPVIEANTLYRIAADGVAAVTIPLPAGTRVVANTIKGIIAPSEGEEFIYSSEFPADDEFVFIPPFPYIGKTVRIIAYAVNQ